jgi:hypothetical protein
MPNTSSRGAASARLGRPQGHASELAARRILYVCIFRLPVVKSKSVYADRFVVPSTCFPPDDSFMNRRNIFFPLGTLLFARRGFGRRSPFAIFVLGQVLLHALV